MPLPYRAGQYTTNSATKEDKEIISTIIEAEMEISKLAMHNSADKNFYHFIGLQGFKRLHRYKARENFEFAMGLDALLIDHYGVEPIFEEGKLKFAAPTKRSILERMQLYIEAIEATLVKMNDVKTKLVMANHHYAAGYIQAIICSLEHDLKYAHRHINYAKDVGGHIKDMHWYSHEIHEEYKCKEKDEHNREFE